MKRLYLLLFLMMSAFSLNAQEVCNNGIDDDADGLIDLNDPDCHCGAGLNAQLNNAIPNPGFDQSSCCPQTWNNQLSCLDAWTTDPTNLFNGWSLYYANSCNGCNFWGTSVNYITPPNCAVGGNEGYLGMSFWNNWSNNNTNWNWNRHANACLTAPLIPGNNYVLEFEAFNTWNWNATGQNWNDTVHFSISGTTSCTNIPFSNGATNTFSCSDPDWQTLDSLNFTVPTDTVWHTYSFSFSPTDTIRGIALGQSCGTNIVQNQWNGWQRLLLDNLTLYDSENYNIQIAETGSICELPYSLSATIDTTGGTWQWYQDSVALIGETNATIDISTLGAGNFTVLYSMNGTCQGLNLEVLPAVNPFVALTASSNSICEGDSIQFDGFAFITSGNVNQFVYDFGNGDSAYVEDVIYTFNTPGTFPVTMTATSDLSCTGAITQNIVVNPKPVANFIAHNECLYDDVNFTSMTALSAGSIDSLSWAFGDNSFGDDSLEVHNYSTHGVYTVELYARSEDGCADSISKTISIHPVPVADYTASDDCENISIDFLNTSTIAAGDIVTYSWKFGNNATANTENTDYTYLIAGDYTTSLLVESDSGCVDSTDLMLEVYPEPHAIFSASSSCFLATFINSSTVGTGSFIETSNWDFGNSATLSLNSSQDTSHYYTVNDSYNVTLETVSNYGCVDDTVINIVISSNFFADLAPKTNQICVGECVQLTNNSTPTPNLVMSYYWQTSDGQTSELANPEFCFDASVGEPTNYDVFFKISTNSGCIDSILVEDAITIIPIPIADFTFTPERPTLSNPIVEFKNLSTLAANYQWNFGDNTSSAEINPTHHYPEVGESYTVRLTATDEDSTCDNEYRQTLVVQDEVLFFIPNTFTPNGTGINDFYKPVFVSGIDVYRFRFQVFNRFGELVFESFDPEGYWNGEYGGQMVQDGIYVWKLDFTETMLDKTHTYTGTVTVLK